MVGYRENSGHNLVSEEDAAQLEATVFDQLLITDGEPLAGEHDLIHLLWWVHSERATETINRVEQLIAGDAFVLGLLRSALGENLGKGVDEAAVRRSHNLNWRGLIEFVPHDRLAQRVRELDVAEVRDGLDEHTKLALQLARRFADDPAAALGDQERDP